MTKRRHKRGKRMDRRVQNFVLKAAAGMVRDVIRSLRAAKVAKKDETARSHILIVAERLRVLREMDQVHGFLTVTGLVEKQVQLLSLIESRFGSGWTEAAAADNARGRELEQSGDVAGALRLYESMASEGVGAPHTYRRLAILHRKTNSREDELRVLKMAIENIPKKDPQLRRWFRDRLAKMKGKKF